MSDGPSDRALVPIVTWSLRRHWPGTIESQWADLLHMHNPPREPVGKIRVILNLYPCELLFVHRDAEAQSHLVRFDEIDQAIEELRLNTPLPPVVRVVPVRMMEAWLLRDETAIRTAANNSNGRMRLRLPRVREIERLADPKDVLCRTLIAASGLPTRRLRSLNPRKLIYRVAQLIGDFSSLDELPAFARFAQELRVALQGLAEPAI